MNTNSIEIIGEGNVNIGSMTSIGSGVKAIFHRPGTITISDYCNIASGVKFVVDGGDIFIGDWSTLHDHCMVLSTNGVKIGQHAWFGQNTVLDGTGGLSIGNGVRVGMYSQIWSHVAAGELIEGCTLYGMRPVNIEDDVWLVGSCICASGITIGRRSIALIGSNITKSWPEYSVIAGSPATLKESLTFYRKILPSEKWEMLDSWLDEAAKIFGLQRFLIKGSFALRSLDEREADVLVFIKQVSDESLVLSDFPNATICCIENKTYLKRLTKLEQKIMKFLSGHKARFLANNIEKAQ